MFEVRVRQVMAGDGEQCQVEGCRVEPREDLVVLSVNGMRVLEMCGPCAGVVGDTLMAEQRHVDLRRQRRAAGEPTD